MAQPQNKRLFIAKIGDISRTCEAYSGAGKKRIESSRPIVMGTGDSRVHKLRDPAMTVDPVTLRFICTRDDPFITAIGAAAEKHRLDPQSAGSLILQAFSDAGAVVASKTLVRACIESFHWSDGDTNASGESVCEVVVDPEDALV
jgi:hypothetical protein